MFPLSHKKHLVGTIVLEGISQIEIIFLIIMPLGGTVFIKGVGYEKHAYP